MKLSASLALWNEDLASETAAGSSSLCWAMSWAHKGRLSLPLKNRNRASGQYGRVEASGKRRDETRGAPPRSQCWNTLPIPWKQDQELYDAMSSGMMALTCRATFSGRYGQSISPFGVLMPGEGIGFNWTNVVSLGRLELSTRSMPSALAHNVCGEHAASQALGIPPCHGQQILAHPKAYTSGTEGNRIKAGRTWLWKLKVDLELRVVGRGCLTTRLLRMHHLRGLVSGL